jgi:hypothetical protein
METFIPNHAPKKKQEKSNGLDFQADVNVVLRIVHKYVSMWDECMITRNNGASIS